MARAVEAFFDGIVGPTHNYARLSTGTSRGITERESSPRAAALEGLAKMKLVADLGGLQGVLPPQERPDVGALRRLGIEGQTDAQVVERAARVEPALLSLCCSASSMWAANSATVSPSADTRDGRVHLTPANLSDRPHRALEAHHTARIYSKIFSDVNHFVVHRPLDFGQALGDEGAANHMRFARVGESMPGVDVFVYGRVALDRNSRLPKLQSARQTREASEAIARHHEVMHAVFTQQHPGAIDEGVMHNDLAAMAHGSLLVFHELAFVDTPLLMETLDERVDDFEPVKILASDVPLSHAVQSCLFNSQIVAVDGERVLVAAAECQEFDTVQTAIQSLIDRKLFREVRYVPLRRSILNGGGPASLRLPIVLTETQRRALSPSLWLTDDLYGDLVSWVENHYRDRLAPADLADPQLIEESRTALDALTSLLELGSIYEFQTAGA